MNQTSLERISETEILIERTFRAPAPIVFDAYTKPEAVVTVTFEERDGVTTLLSHERYSSKEALEGAIASDMEAGLRVTFDQLDALVTSAGG